MVILKNLSNTGQKNMQIDSDLLEHAIKNNQKEPILRLYSWSPACVSLGRNQNDKFLDYDFLKKNGIDVVRRLTGGRALLHDKEITYSFICPQHYLKNGQSVALSYKEICGFLIEAFSSLGINLEFGEKKSSAQIEYCMSLSTGADLNYMGKKFIGSAQFRKEGYILQHGSILLDFDEELLNQIFKIDNVSGSLISLMQINPKIKPEDVQNALVKTFDCATIG